MIAHPVLADGINHLWFIIPLIVVISLVYAATRHEAMGPMIQHAVRFAIWIVAFMAVLLVVFQALTWLV